jgi:glycosyltransferase involved in cell wall biosynthesis
VIAAPGNTRDVVLTNCSMEQALLVGTARPRVALISDFAEEQWPSMELISHMLFEHLERSHSTDLVVERLCPRLQRRFGRLPMRGSRFLFQNADRLIGRFVDYPRWLRHRTAEFDLFHIVDHSYSQLAHSLPPERTVITCHDLDTFRCLLDPEAEQRPRWFRAMTARILNGFQKAAHVIAVSAATRNELLRYGIVPPDRISVIHNGVHPACSPVPDPLVDAELASYLPADSREDTWLLSVGSTIARKRLDVLIEVFARVRLHIPRVRLLRVGGGFTPQQLQLVRTLGLENVVHVLPYLTPRQLASVYRKADFLLQTSEAEGFGLPLGEAMACGCPVVASDLPVLREVGGVAASYCPVGNLDSWTERVVQLLHERSQDVAVWGLRSKGSIAQAARFSWVESASQTAAVYKTMFEHTRVS